MSIFTESKNSFEGQQSDETVILLLRRHWFVLIAPFFAFVVLAIFPIVLYLFVSDFFVKFDLVALYWFLIAIYFVIWWVGLFYRLMFYLLDVWIVTDYRIIDSRQLGFFNRKVAEARIYKVQDVTTKIVGLFNTILDFGDVEIQTAGTDRNFMFKQVPDPKNVRDAVIRAMNTFRDKHPHEI